VFWVIWVYFTIRNTLPKSGTFLLGHPAYKLSLFPLGTESELKSGRMENLTSDLLLELECPVCMEYMLPPIALCQNGHNICSSCKSKLDSCPTCRTGFTDVRNLSLENMCRKVKLPCKYTRDGCSEVLPMDIDIITKHQSECRFRIYTCPFLIASIECPWTGIITDIKDHIKSEHNEASDARDVLGIHNARLPNFETSSAWCQALFTMNEVFFRLSKVIDGFLYCCVLYVGPKVKASMYNYILTIRNNEGKGSVCAVNETVEYRSDVSEIIRNGNCAVFHCEFAKTCINENDELVLEEEIFNLAS
jgi:E3 ubiquitin-protein ligase SIAH1